MHFILFLIVAMLVPTVASGFCVFADDDGVVEDAWMLANHVEDPGKVRVYWECRFEPSDHARSLVTPPLAPNQDVQTADLNGMRDALFAASGPVMEVLVPCDGAAKSAAPKLPILTRPAPTGDALAATGLAGKRLAGLRETYGSGLMAPVAAGTTSIGFTTVVSKLAAIPVRASKTPHAHLTVFVLGKSRYEPSNFSNGFIPNNGVVRARSLDRADDVFAALMAKTVTHHPKTVLTSFAWEQDGNTLTRMRFDALPAKYKRDLIVGRTSPIVGGNEARDQGGKRFRGANSGATNAYRTRLLVETQPAADCWSLDKTLRLKDGIQAVELADYIAEPFPAVYTIPAQKQAEKASAPGSDAETPNEMAPQDSDPKADTCKGCSSPLGMPSFLSLLAVFFVRRRRDR